MAEVGVPFEAAIVIHMGVWNGRRVSPMVTPRNMNFSVYIVTGRIASGRNT